MISQNFGKCFAFKIDDILISGFLTALQSFSKKIAESTIKSINFENFTLHFYNDLNDSSVLYVIVTNIDFDPKEINFKMHKISKLFYEKYSNYLKNFNGDITPFSKFIEILIQMKIVQKNCGRYSDCNECSYNGKTNYKFETLKKYFITKYSNLKETSEILQVKYIILLKISEINSRGKIDILFQKGIGLSLIKCDIELFLRKIITKKQGSSIIPMEDFIIYIYSFKIKKGDLLTLVCMDKKTEIINYSKFYLLAIKIKNKICSNIPMLDLKNFIDESVKITNLT
ncbi:MAG: hypothetical protein ACFFAN_03440 [Promethearchaeota archaeon]